MGLIGAVESPLIIGPCDRARNNLPHGKHISRAETGQVQRVKLPADEMKVHFLIT
jgi:hypothetical protein